MIACSDFFIWEEAKRDKKLVPKKKKVLPIENKAKHSKRNDLPPPVGRSLWKAWQKTLSLSVNELDFPTYAAFLGTCTLKQLFIRNFLTCFHNFLNCFHDKKTNFVLGDSLSSVSFELLSISPQFKSKLTKLWYLPT